MSDIYGYHYDNRRLKWILLAREFSIREKLLVRF